MSDLSIQWLIVFVDASVKATLVALVATAGLALLRVRDSNLRHRVWTGVLCGMLLLPALTQVVPALRLPFTVNAEWFATLDRPDDDVELEQIADLSGQDEETTALKPTTAEQSAPFDLESTARDDGRAMAGRSDWRGAPGRWTGEVPGGRTKSLGPPDNSLAADPNDQAATAAAPAAVEPEPANNNEPRFARRQPASRAILSYVPLVFWTVWIAGGLVMGLRLLAGLWMARSLRRASHVISPAELPSLITNIEPNVPPRRTVPILMCPLIRVPLTLGVVRPQILLPLDWTDWTAEKLQAVLAHERTHAERGDCALALLAEVNRCVYWFHPLAWWLRQRLASLAEAACDDAAIGSTGDRARYARHLLEVAATARAHRGRLVAGGVSMARRSNVETRITSILDFSRPLSQRLTWGTALVLVGVIVPLVALAAALRPSNGEIAVQSNPESTAAPSTEDTVQSTQDSVLSTSASAQDKPETTAASITEDSKLSTEYSVLSTQLPAQSKTESSKPESSPGADVAYTFAGTVVDPDGKPTTSQPRTIRGRVVDDKGQPIAGVPLQVPVIGKSKKLDETPDVSLVTKAKTAADGEFAVQIAADELPAEQSTFTLKLVAQLPGYGVEWLDLPNEGDVAAAEIVLSPEQLIRGRMIDAEGRAVVGAKITVESLTAPQSGNSLDSFLEERKKIARQPTGRHLSYALPRSFEMLTDADGRFVIHGVAAERVCRARIAADHFVTAMLVIANRPGLDPAPYNQPVGPLARLAPNRLVGPDFTHVGAPGLTIDGRVTAEGGKPVVALRVVAGQFAPLTYATTDADGRYQLSGLPRGGEVMLRYGLDGHDGLLPQTMKLATTADDSQKTVDVELKRAILLSGRVLDRSTGKGAPHAAFQLVPLAGNEHVGKPGYEEVRQNGTSGRADDNGNFQVVAFPGPAALIVNEPGDLLVIGGQHFTSFRTGHVSQDDEAKLKLAALPGGERGIPTAAGLRPLMQTIAVKYVNLPADGASQPVDVELDRGQTVELDIVDADGQPVIGAAIAGIGGANPTQPVRLQASRTTIYALGGGTIRKIVVLHGARGLAGSITLTGKEASPVRLTLVNTGSVRGRAVDEFKAPIIGTEYGFRSYSTDGLRTLENFGQPQPATDKDGRFRIANLVPGEPFTLSMRLDGNFRNAKISKTQQAPESGQDIDLGDVVFAPRKPGKTIDLELVDADGQLVTGAAISGLEELNLAFRLRESKTTVYALDGESPRTVVVLHGPRGLGGSVTLTGAESSPVRLTLGKTASFRGRAVDKTGEPISGATCRIFSNTTCQLFELENAGRPEVTTDEKGRFRIGNLIPGERFELRLRLGGKLLSAKLTDGQQTLNPGQEADLGDVVFVPPDQPVRAQNEAGKPTPPLDPPANGGKKVVASPSAGQAGLATTISVNGVVLKPDGSPAAGATVRAAAALWAMLEPIVGADFKSPMSETKADAKGRFSISFSTQPFGDLSQLGERWHEVWKRTEIAASLDGFGPAWIEYGEIDSQQAVTLKLVEDVRLRGRVVDLEGRPVAGTTVKVSGPQTSKDEDLSAWIEGIKVGELPWVVYRKASRSVEPRLVGTPTLVTTDANGTFEIRGLGRERIVDLTFEGETVAHRTASAVTRDMQPIRRIISRPPFEGAEPVFGAEFTYTADPARTIEGVVRDAKSGEPLAGVSVESDKLVGYPYSNNRVLKTKSDNLGRFRLTGMPKGSGNRLLLIPNDDQPYFMREVDVPDPVGLGPAKMEIDLHRGIWITGRVTDKATGKPVPGVRLHYLPFRSNEYAQRTPEFDSDGNVDGDQSRYVANSEGTYRLVGLPGRAIVGAESVLKDYRRGVGYDAIDAPKYENTDHFDTYRNPIDPSPKWPSVMREINPAVDAVSVSLDLQLDPGQSLRIRVVGPDGQSVSGVSVTGLSSDGNVKESHEPILVASNFGPGETRIVLFHHEKLRLGRVVTIGPKQLDAGEMIVELQPCATIVGRILNADGLPVTGMALRLDVLPGGDFFRHLPQVSTDAEGRFRVTLLPGCQYSFNGEGGGFQFVNFVKELSIEPGEKKDMGTLTVDKDGKVVPQTASGPAKATVPSTEYSVLSTQSPAQNNAVPGKSQSTTIGGTILNPDGKPAAKATVAVIGLRRHTERGGDRNSRGDVLAETSTDGDGRFQMKLSGISSLTHIYAHVIASAENAGLGWRRIDPDERDVTASFRLPAELPIRGRLIDIEGQPAAGVRVSVNSIWATFPNGRVDDGVQYDEFDNPPKAWPQATTTDAKGSFAIRHSPAAHFFFLVVAGTDQIASQSLRINAGAPEPQENQNAAYRALFKDVKPNAETVFAVAPAQIFEGVVRYADTGEPAPHARLTIWSSQQEGRGSSSGLAGKADAHGRYRINPYPGVRFGVTAYPPDGAPYLTRKVRDIIRKAGARVKQVDVTLPRGSIVRGRVVESGAKTPVPRAVIQYIPEKQNNPNATDDVVTGWEGIQLSGDDGAFEIAVLPGPGTLLVNGPEGKFVMQVIGSRQLDRGIAGGQRNYAHAILHVNPETNSDPLDLTIELRRGATISGRIVNAAGEPVDQALVLTRLSMNPSDLTWRGFPVEALGGRFELSGLAEGIEYPVYFLDAKNRLGATVMVKADDKSPTVTLLPCGQASATIIDDSGKPMVGYFPWLDMVLTPGPDRFETAADAPGVLAGDTAYVLNIDRTNYQNATNSDEQGRITYPALIPGGRYRIITYEKGIAINLKEFVAESGKTLELGKIVYGPAPKDVRQDQQGADATAPAKAGVSSAASDQGTARRSGESFSAIHGRVSGPDGKPAVKAHVAVIGRRIQPERGGDLPSRSDVLAEGETDDSGSFKLQLTGASSKSLSWACVIARSDSSGLAWRRMDPDAHDVDVSFELPAEQVVRGRFIDIEGQPAGAVRISIRSVSPRGAAETRIEPVGFYAFDKPPLAWPPNVTADQTGSFEIHGISADHGFYLAVEGTDRFAPQDVALNTGFPEQRPERDATYRSLVRNFKPGEDVVLPLAPAQIFEGVVRFADTGEPAPHARLTIWASQQEFGGSMYSLAGKADAEGRYRINPHPGVRFGITAYPPDGVPYLIRQTRDIARKDGALVKHVDLSLPRGVLVRGHVIESGTKAAVAGAAIQYIPESFNNPNAKDDIITGWEGIQISEESGAFAIAVLPGPGRLLVNGPTGEFVAREIGYQQLERGLPGGERTYAHAIERINPDANSEPIEMTVELQRGATVAGRITNAAGEPVEQALLLTRLNLHQSELTWRGFPIETLGGRFELSGLARGVEYPAYFLDAKNRLGAALKLKSDDSTPVAVLLPCGEAVATFVDKTGKPVADFNLNLEFVLTRGTHRLDLKAMRLNSTAAEAAYVVNVDRTNYRTAPTTDANGRVTLPALIPGARYRIITYANGGPAILKEFVAESQKTLELGTIKIEIPKEE